MFSLDHYEWRMPRTHYGRRNTREYAQRRHHDMEGNLVLPIFPDPEDQYREGWLWRNAYCRAMRGSSLQRRGASEDAWSSMQAAKCSRGTPKGLHQPSQAVQAKECRDMVRIV
ncbi:BnaAnng40210D [Brassica napus]|uniref:BnaAnng40210D protein n=1 Tax=Brassica napus TaxID=3708 RepID=A0A078JX07_BRANA|nr:BnaAnng40210D [Brassica napus]